MASTSATPCCGLIRRRVTSAAQTRSAEAVLSDDPPADPDNGSAPAPARASLFVVVGPSGVGKGTVIRAVLDQHPEVWLSVSATTRHPRPGEVEGESYFFLLRAEFERRIAAGEMLEWAEYSGHLYGTPRQPVMDHLAAGAHVLLEIELQGARQIRRSMPEACFVFLAPPSWDELEVRLRSRGTESPEALELRLEAARVEMAACEEFEEVIVNAEVGEAARQLVALMQSR